MQRLTNLSALVGVIDHVTDQRRRLGVGGRKDVSYDNGRLYVVGINTPSFAVLGR